ncbi:unnamed protein product [Sphagnum tenellum]
MEIGGKSNERRTKIERKSDGCRTSKAQPPLLLWQVATLHCSSWQRNAAARLAERCNSQLWRGRQSVLACYCGEAGSGLQFGAVIMANSAATRGAGRAALQFATMVDSAL